MLNFVAACSVIWVYCGWDHLIAAYVRQMWWYPSTGIPKERSLQPINIVLFENFVLSLRTPFWRISLIWSPSAVRRWACKTYWKVSFDLNGLLEAIINVVLFPNYLACAVGPLHWMPSRIMDSACLLILVLCQHFRCNRHLLLTLSNILLIWHFLWHLRSCLLFLPLLWLSRG